MADPDEDVQPEQAEDIGVADNTSNPLTFTLHPGLRNNSHTVIVNGKGFVKDRHISDTKYYARCKYFRSQKCPVRGVVDLANSTIVITR